MSEQTRHRCKNLVRTDVIGHAFGAWTVLLVAEPTPGAEVGGMGKTVLWRRLKSGWSPIDAVLRPIDHRNGWKRGQKTPPRKLEAAAAP